MLSITCCPVIKIFSITTLILLAVLGMYIAEIVKGIDKSKVLLQIKAQVLLDLGANYSPNIKDGQVWRLISAQFLHINFIHLVGNVLTIIIFVSRVEYTFNAFRTLFIYILSGIGGNIFSCLTNPSDNVVKAGASTCLYGIIGAIIGYIIINWTGLNVIGRLLKCQLVFIAIMIIMFIFVLTPYSDNIDYMGHLGGFLTGLTASAIHSTIRNGKR
jgi:rhomboid protease GluP